MNENPKRDEGDPCCTPADPDTDEYFCEYYKEDAPQGGSDWQLVNAQTPSTDFYCCAPDYRGVDTQLYLHPCPIMPDRGTKKKCCPEPSPNEGAGNDAKQEHDVSSSPQESSRRTKGDFAVCYAKYRLKYGNIYCIDAVSTGEGVGAPLDLIEYSTKDERERLFILHAEGRTEINTIWKGLFMLEAGQVTFLYSDATSPKVPADAISSLLEYSDSDDTTDGWIDTSFMK
jgi:hypothetical protein